MNELIAYLLYNHILYIAHNFMFFYNFTFYLTYNLIYIFLTYFIGYLDVLMYVPIVYGFLPEINVFVFVKDSAILPYSPCAQCIVVYKAVGYRRDR